MVTGLKKFQEAFKYDHDMRLFVDAVRDQIPSDDILKKLGAGDLSCSDLYTQLGLNFNLA